MTAGSSLIEAETTCYSAAGIDDDLEPGVTVSNTDSVWVDKGDEESFFVRTNDDRLDLIVQLFSAPVDPAAVPAPAAQVSLGGEATTPSVEGCSLATIPRGSLETLEPKKQDISGGDWGRRRWNFRPHKWNRASFRYVYVGGRRKKVHKKRFILCGVGFADPDPDRNGVPFTRLRWQIGAGTIKPVGYCHPDDGEPPCFDTSLDYLVDPGAFGSWQENGAKSSLDVAVNICCSVTLASANIQSYPGGEWRGSWATYEPITRSPEMDAFYRNVVNGFWKALVSIPYGATEYRAQTVQGVWETEQVSPNPKLAVASRFHSCIIDDQGSDHECKSR